jgi:hypothetical protein
VESVDLIYPFQVLDGDHTRSPEVLDSLLFVYVVTNAFRTSKMKHADTVFPECSQYKLTHLNPYMIVAVRPEWKSNITTSMPVTVGTKALFQTSLCNSVK